MSSTALEILGWAGSVVLVVSLLQARVVRLRQLNLVASIVLVAYNAMVGVWPMVAVNVAIAVVNVVHLVRLVRTRHDPDTYAAVEVDADGELVAHLLRRHHDDVEAFNPGFRWDGSGPDAIAFVVMRQDETVGLVLVTDRGGGTAEVALDYVVPRFRDFTPGEFVYRRSGVFTDRGFHTVLAPPRMRDLDGHLARVGFTDRDGRRVLDLPAST